MNRGRYRPYVDPQVAALLFIHGGGWVAGDLDTNERTLRLLALESGLRILSIDYPLSPEAKFPVALDVCTAVARWARTEGHEWGLDPDRLGLGGDSAGGNLALATAMDLRDAREDWLRYLLLVYPALSPSGDTPSYRTFGTGDYGIGLQGMRFFWNSYLNSEADHANPRAAPLLAGKNGLPPTCLLTAGLDPLTDECLTLARQLESAGVPLQHHHYDGVIHGFFSMSRMLDAGARAVADAAAFLAGAAHQTRESGDSDTDGGH